jgi:hypothetical protein
MATGLTDNEHLITVSEGKRGDMSNELGAGYLTYLKLASKPARPAPAPSARACRPARGAPGSRRFLSSRRVEPAIDIAAVLAPYTPLPGIDGSPSAA